MKKLLAALLFCTLVLPVEAQPYGPGSAPITTIGGYEFNVYSAPTVQNSSYTAGQSLGGLLTISVGGTNSLTGILDQVVYNSKGGATAATTLYVWDKNPTNSTCTDKTNFVSSQTDNQHLVIPPTALTPALAVTAQDTSTYASAANLTGNFANASTNTNLYACLVANATQTPGSTSDVLVKLQGIRDQP